MTSFKIPALLGKCLIAGILVSGILGMAGTTLNAEVNGTVQEDEESTKSLYDFKVKSIEGEEVDLSKYKGKTVLLVNVASKCGYTRQYADMQKIYSKYKDRDFVILGFPCNQFGGQEPGSESEIKEFCTKEFGVTFPMFAKIDVKGSDQAPLYRYLTELETEPKGAGTISWNFEKFLIGPDGKVIGRYASKVNPSSPEMMKTIEGLLPESEKEGDQKN